MALAGLKQNRRGSVRAEGRRAKMLTGSEEDRGGGGEAQARATHRANRGSGWGGSAAGRGQS